MLRTTSGRFHGFSHTKTTPTTRSPTRLTIPTSLGDTIRCDRGRYSADSECVSIWKQSVSAWPKPYERKNARKASKDGTGSSSIRPLRAIPESPAAPDTNNR